ncbi:DNA/RNA non-specific endonuclease [Saccharothrix algeriensis]|uniref:Serine protease n=2 Tax=Catellatospora bangladeshensis TaxID=310355 RepID=A0A8J3NMC6_9ACTN|nr:serine protease [Catellatospora bangladeshensis]
MRRFQSESIMKDERLVSEIAELLPEMESQLSGLPNGHARHDVSLLAETRDPITAERAVREALSRESRVEAIVQRLGRPTLLVRNDTFELPQAKIWRSRLYPAKSRLDAAIRSVGRLEVTGLSVPYAGTAWMIAPGIAVTNRHVVAELVRPRGGEFVFRASPIGQPLTARLDFKEEYAGVRPFEVRVKRVLYVADQGADAPDLAFIELEAPKGRLLPPPVPLYEGEPQPGQVVAVIGYPAEDPRNSLLDQTRLFGGIYDVKRLAPGEVMGKVDRKVFTHDCTTLGGSSGSVVIDVETGGALGLHFAGEYLDANYAVTVAELRRHLQKLDGTAKRAVRPQSVSLAQTLKPEPEARVSAASLQDRPGFDETFLGTAANLKTPLPELSAALAEVAAVVDADAPGSARHLLKYQHFSIAMHTERKFAIFTASNIDGSLSRMLKRGQDRWSFDPRLDASLQVGNALYAGNDLDRGHLVRRLDPAWGSLEDAKRAEKDTFFFTNATPQHIEFNQHLWLELEDYLLGHADTLDFRACVYTGPVFSEEDPEYRGVQLPRAFWKVAVMVHAETGKLTATAYTVSQADLITDIEFVFGQFKTYQVPIARIEELTGLRFGKLKNADPLAREETVPGAMPLHELRRLEDIRLA